MVGINIRGDEKTRRLLRSAVAVFALVTALALLGWLDGLDGKVLDAALTVRGPAAPAERVVVIGMDRQSAGAGVGAPPWDAALFARLLGRLAEAEAAVVVLDFPDLPLALEGMYRPQAQAFLAEAMQAVPVVLPLVLREGTPPPGADTAGVERFTGPGDDLPVLPFTDTHIEAPPALLLANAAGAGLLNVFPELDGTLRAVPLLVRHHDAAYPALALETLRVAEGAAAGQVRFDGRRVHTGRRSITALPTGEVLVNFSAGSRRIPDYPLARVLDEAVSAQHLQQALGGRIVIIGPLQGLGAEFFNTPVTPRMPGVYVQANAVADLLAESHLRPLPTYVLVPLLLLAALVTCRLTARTSPVVGMMLTGAGTAAAFALSAYLLTHFLWLPAGGLCLAVALTGLVTVGRRAGEAEHERLRQDENLRSRLQAIAGMGRLAASGLDRRELVDAIMRWVAFELDVEACSLLLVDSHTGLLRFEAALGPRAQEAMSFTLEPGEGIAGTVAATGKPLILNDARQDKRRNKDIAMAVEYEIDNMLCVPVSLRGKVIGVLQAMNKLKGDGFGDSDLAVLEVIAQQAALFLENARLFDVLQKRVDFANEELREAMGKLTAEKARIETLVEELVDGVIATDAADRILIINQAAAELLNLQAEKLIGEPLLAIIRHPRITDLFLRPLYIEGGPVAEEIDLWEDGSCVVRATVMHIEQEGERIAGKCLVLNNITHFKQMDRIKTDLISFVSHELRNPLAVISLYAKTLQKLTHKIANERTTEALTVLIQQSARMGYLVDDFLDVARIEDGIPLAMEFSRIDDVKQLVDDVIKLQGLALEDHTFTVNLSGEMPPLWADRRKMQQVFVNLVNNAIKYSPDGGVVEVGGRSAGEMFEFFVRDAGIGIKPEDQANLFQRFRRSRQLTAVRIPGTGLGLFMCKAITEAHGGEIRVHSEPGQGATFSFTLPLYRGQDADGDTEQAP